VGADGVELELEEIGIWELTEAFRGVLASTMANSARLIVYDDTPLEKIVEDIIWRLAESGNLRFFDLVGNLADRARLISYFLGLLELAKINKIRLLQERDGGDIYVTLRTDVGFGREANTEGTGSKDGEMDRDGGGEK
jgi:chromatin segregation and condensation protein Rec8/ScpA/Scc1 (kleisin family)